MIESIERDPILSSIRLPDNFKKSLKHNRYMRTNMNWEGKSRPATFLKKYD